MTDTEESKEISVDGEILNLKKYSEYNNTIQKTKLIIVEGKDDLYFFNYYLEFLKIKNIEVRYIGCKFGPAELSTFIKSHNNFGSLESLGLACDADGNSAKKEFVRLKIVIEDINKNPPLSGTNLLFPDDINSFSKGVPKIGIFIFPNNNDNGMLEDLFLKCMNDKPGMKCVKPFMECVHVLDKPPINRSKANALAYLATLEKTMRGVGGAAREGLWDFNSNELSEVKAFVKKL